MAELNVALKEWDAIRQALRAGRQSLLLRKGGIHEPDGGFRVEHERFWIYPTFTHQGDARVGTEVMLDTLADVVDVQRVTSLAVIERLADLHVWTAEDVARRFHYREPGLFVLTVRVSRAQAHSIHETAEYAGCKSWVRLDTPLTIHGVEPVLMDAPFAAVREEIAARLR